MRDGAKFCSAPNTNVEKKKKVNANQVSRNLIRSVRRTLLGLSRRVSWLGSSSSVCDNSPRFHHRADKDVQPAMAAVRPATRQLNAVAMAVISSGPTAQPRLPERP